MKYETKEIEAVGRLAHLVGDPWEIGKEVARLKPEYGLTDEDIGSILEEKYDRHLARSTIQGARETFEIFGHHRIHGFGFSHHLVASIAAKDDLRLRGKHTLSEEQILAVRQRAAEVLTEAHGESDSPLTVTRLRAHIFGQSPSPEDCPVSTSPAPEESVHGDVEAEENVQVVPEPRRAGQEPRRHKGQALAGRASGDMGRRDTGASVVVKRLVSTIRKAQPVDRDQIIVALIDHLASVLTEEEAVRVADALGTSKMVA